MPAPAAIDSDSNILRSVIEHVFMPPKLPQEDPGEEIGQETNVALCNNLIEAAQDFLQNHPSQPRLWTCMVKMMKLVRHAATVPFKEVDLQRTLSRMTIGGASISLALHFAFGSITFYQTYLPYIYVHKMLPSLCEGLPSPTRTSFSSRCSKSRRRIPM